jgi:hypothetical protein
VGVPGSGQGHLLTKPATAPARRRTAA